MPTTPCPDSRTLRRLLGGEVPAAESESLAVHVEACAGCAAKLAWMPDEDRLLAAMRSGKAPAGRATTPAPAELRQRLRALHPSDGSAALSTAVEAAAGPPSTQVVAESGGVLDPGAGPDETGRIAGYRVLHRLGAGGMGVVFAAEDPHLKRHIALKVMSPKLAAETEARERFLREAQAMAAIEHDHIVAIYQVGEHRGLPFLAMPLLRGESLEARLEREPCLSPAEVVRIGKEAADGLAAAHERGLIHRDIKPSNLWLEEGKGRVKVLDFGLARPADGTTGLTQQGVVVGTPAFMSPEQAQGESLDPRTDLFSLGCVLYRAATGQAPFRGDTVIATLASVLQHDPPPLRQLNPEVPRALDDLVRRLLAKQRQRRPASARDVADALQAMEPVVAVRPRRRSRLLVRVGLATFFLALALVAAPVIIRIFHKDGRVTEIQTESGERIEVRTGDTTVTVHPAPAAPSPPSGARRVAPSTAVTVRPAPAAQPPAPPRHAAPPVANASPVTVLIDDVLRQIAQHRAAGAPAGPSPLDSLRREDIPLEKRQVAGDPPELVAVLGDNKLVGRQIALSPDGKRIAATSKDRVRIWRAEDGALLQVLKWTFSTSLDRVCYSPDGRYLAGASFGYVVVWDTSAGTPERSFRGDGLQGIGGLAFSPDSRLLAFGNSTVKDSYEVIIWNLATEEASRLKGPTKKVHDACFSPDGRKLAAGAGQSFHEGELFVWDVGSGDKVYSRTDFKSDVQRVAYSPDGKLLALGHGYSGAEVRLLDASTYKEVRVLDGQQYEVEDLAFDRDGERLASAGRRQGICLWQVKDGRLRVVDPSGDVNSVCFSPDGRWLLSVADDDRIRAFDLLHAERRYARRGHSGAVRDFAVSLDGTRLASFAADGTVRWWDLARGDELECTRLEAGAFDGVLAPGGLLVVGRIDPNVLTVWDSRKGSRLRDFRAREHWDTKLSPDGRYVACKCKDGYKTALNVWDLRDGRLVHGFQDFDYFVDGFAFLPDGTHLAISDGKEAHKVVVHDLATGKAGSTLANLGTDSFNGLSPDGRHLITYGPGYPPPIGIRPIGTDGTAGNVVHAERPRGAAGSSDPAWLSGWSPDGRFVAGGCTGIVAVWDAETGKVWHEFPLAVGFTRVKFAPDGRHLVAGSPSGALYIFRLGSRPKAAK
jgi:WD40 repeat protein